MGRRRLTRQRGSVLMLVPAGMLVLVILGAISVDSAIAFLAQRELQNASAAAVNDAVTVAISPEALQRGEAAAPDIAAAAGVIHRALDGYDVAGLRVHPEDVTITSEGGGRILRVDVSGEVPYLFAGAIPGARSAAQVRAMAQAELVVSP